MATIRTALSQQQPHVATKKAWTEAIRTLRLAKKRGASTRLHARSAIDRLLDAPIDESMDLARLKTLLRELLRCTADEARIEVALQIDRLTADWLLPQWGGPVNVSVKGWPEWLPCTIRSEMTGLAGEFGVLQSAAASALRFHLDGYRLANHRLSVTVETPAGSILPAPRRSDRSRKRRRGARSWLPYFDEEGHYSASPKEVARENGEIMARTGLTVLDPFCGVGGDAIGAAMSGAAVVASDSNADRVRLARENAAHFQLTESISFKVSDVETAISARDLSNVCLFLDPPWGGKNWDKATMNLDQWLFRWPSLRTAIQNAGAVLIKAPRTFDLDSLFSLRESWDFGVGIESDEDHPADKVRILRAFGCCS